MEKNLEHKIKEAFQKKDSTVTYSRKDELWNRMENHRNAKKGVAAFWRIAAVLLAIFFITGAFAGIRVIFKTQHLNYELTNENIQLKYAVDSLTNIQPEVITETKIVEKEVPVYLPAKTQSNSSNEYKTRIEELNKRNSALQNQLNIANTNLRNEIDSLRNELLALKSANQNRANQVKQTKKESDVIKLKSENYDTLYQKKPNSENPKIKLQIFNNPAQKEQVQMNSSIFKQ